MSIRKKVTKYTIPKECIDDLYEILNEARTTFPTVLFRWEYVSSISNFMLVFATKTDNEDLQDEIYDKLNIKYKSRKFFNDYTIGLGVVEDSYDSFEKEWFDITLEETEVVQRYYHNGKEVTDDTE